MDKKIIKHIIDKINLQFFHLRLIHHLISDHVERKIHHHLHHLLFLHLHHQLNQQYFHLQVRLPIHHLSQLHNLIFSFNY